MPPSNPRARIVLAGTVVVLAILAAYANSLAAPFVFDDPLAIVANPTIRKLWPLSDVLLPPRGEGLSVEGRPIVNLTLAVNYAFGGTTVRGYHGVNIAIHALAALTLLGLVRRTLLLPRLCGRFGDVALPLATAIALLWALHPLQTESVTYVVQRAESLVGLFYLLTLYCFVRAAEPVSGKAAPNRDRPGKEREKIHPRRSVAWAILAFVACLLGMATKEVMVSAPLLVLLFDRVFAAGSFRAAWAQRRALHVALFSTWLLLGLLVLGTGTRGGTAGFGIGVSPWDYALTQCEAITRYLALTCWPHPLVFDYGVAWVQRPLDVLPHALVVIGLAAATLIAWRRAPAAAWLGLLFFAVLAPTSSFVPGNRQTIAEHRMYLPLAAAITLAVGAARGRQGALVVAAIAAAFGVLTARRNADYASALTLYRDNVAKRPHNGFARYNLGRAYAEAGRHAAAIAEYEASLRLMPGVAQTHNNLGNSLAAAGRTTEALAHYESAVRLDPRYANAHFNLGNLLVAAGDKAAAREHFRTAVALAPQLADARTNFASVLLELGELDAARAQFEIVLQSAPDSVEALFGLGTVFLLRERWDEAARAFETVVRRRPDLAVARERLEIARARSR